MIRPATIAIVTLVFLSVASFATTAAKLYAVGNCQPNLQSYPSISLAVGSVPPGSTILVCPGNYPEQVQITQPLTLKGLLVKGSGAAVVTVPSAGLTQNTTSHSGIIYYYQILVQNTAGPVNITDLGVDGAGGSPPIGFLAGIFYQEASGTLSSVSARNQTTSNGHPADGIVAESFVSVHTLTVQNCSVRAFNNVGIGLFTDTATPLLTETLKGNYIRGNGNSSSGAGIYVIGSRCVTGPD